MIYTCFGRRRGTPAGYLDRVRKEIEFESEYNREMARLKAQEDFKKAKGDK